MKDKTIISTKSKNSVPPTLDLSYREAMENFFAHDISAGIICCEISEKFPITFVNDYFLDLLKYKDTAELLKNNSGNFLNLLAGNNGEEELQQIRFALLSDGKLNQKRRLLAKDGTPIWISCSGKRYTLECGKEIAILLCMDITGLVDFRNQLMTKQNQLSLANKKYKAKLKTEPLTKLLNREFLELSVKKYLTKSRGHYASIMVDLDDFKITNDTFGHLCGDAVLIATANHITETFRKTDLISRYGGDEFLIFLPDVGSLKNCEKKVQQLYDRFKEPFYYKDFTMKIKVSIGVVYNQTKSRYTFREIYEKTDAAMYQSKYAGKDQYYIELI